MNDTTTCWEVLFTRVSSSMMCKFTQMLKTQALTNMQQYTFYFNLVRNTTWIHIELLDLVEDANLCEHNTNIQHAV